MKPSVYPSIFNLPLQGRPLLSFMEDLWAVFFVPCVSGNVGRTSARRSGCSLNMCVLFTQNQQLLFVFLFVFLGIRLIELREAAALQGDSVHPGGRGK